MSLRNSNHRWGAVSQGLHWGILLLLGWMAWRGLTMVELEQGPAMIRAYALHKSVGLTLLVLVAVRIGWRLHAGAPAPVPGTPAWQARVARITHGALYALMFALPLSGWLFNSASGFPLQWFKLFNLPAIAGRDAALAELARQAHVAGFWVLVLLVAAHAGAAVYHPFTRRDDTLRRMLPGATSRHAGTTGEST